MFNQTCEYAVRTAIAIARHDAGQYVLARELSLELDIPHQYLAKILQQLAKSKVLESSRGRLGGFRLARAAAKTRLLDIVAPFEDLRRTDQCVMGQKVCSDATACPMHDFWATVRKRYHDELEGKTLADFVNFENSRRSA